MICRIADLLVEIPTAGGMAPRCAKYECYGEESPDVIISADKYRTHLWPEQNFDGVCYMESGIQFYTELLHYNGLMLHASAVEMNGYAFLFSGPSGMGKTTHTRLWCQVFGETVQVFNDDKPALRKINGVWYAYGTPWSGKDYINQNKRVPLAGICFLRQAKENCIRSLSTTESIYKIIAQTRRKFKEIEKLDLMLSNVGQLVQDIPIFELENRPESEAAKLSYETMLKAAQERNL